MSKVKAYQILCVINKVFDMTHIRYTHTEYTIIVEIYNNIFTINLNLYIKLHYLIFIQYVK